MSVGMAENSAVGRRYTGQGQGVGAGAGGHRKGRQIAFENLGLGGLGGAGVMIVAIGHGAVIIGRDQGGEHLGRRAGGIVAGEIHGRRGHERGFLITKIRNSAVMAR